jgi:hypothetical protein
VLHIINEQQLLQGSEKKDFEKLLQRVMSRRNAFAHGKLSSSDKAVWISYFEGGPRKQELTDQFLTEVESTLRSACEQCLALGRKMGVFINVERSGAGKAGDSAASI